MNDSLTVWIMKALAALAGASFSLAFAAPKTVRQTIIRISSGVFVGLFFGTLTVALMEKVLDIPLGSETEKVVIGAFVASFVSWFAFEGVARFLMAVRSPSDFKRE